MASIPLRKRGIEYLGAFEVNGQSFKFHLARHLSGEKAGIRRDNEVYLLRGLRSQELVDYACGFVSEQCQDAIDNDEWAEWREGLFIGNRRIDVKLVRGGIEPFDVTYDLENNEARICTSGDRATLVQRAVFLANKIWAAWRVRAIREALEREKALPELPPEPKRKQKSKPKVTPGELLPPAERKDVLAEGDDVLRKILGDSEEKGR